MKSKLLVQRLSIPCALLLGSSLVGKLLPARSEPAPQANVHLSVEQIKAEHQHVLDSLNVKNEKGVVMDLDDPQVPALLKKGWDLAGQWAAAYLEAHPSPSKADLKHIFDGFAPERKGVKSKYGDFLEYTDYSFSGGAIRLGPSVYVIQAEYLGIDFPTGTFMVVARNPEGHFQALWNIKDLAEKHYPQRDEIGRWLHLVRHAYYNGPLDVDRILPLSPALNGHARFLVNAFQGADGGTALAQLSIWEWDGAEALPLLVGLYQCEWDSCRLRFDGQSIRVSTKEELHTFYSCGMCPEPRGVWIVRITATGVQNLGHRFIQPEIQWTDELLWKIQKGEESTELADPQVVEAIKARIREEQAEATHQTASGSDQNEFWWGMMSKCHILRRGQQGAFLLPLDEGELRFSYVLRHGKPYFTDVRIK